MGKFIPILSKIHFSVGGCVKSKSSIKFPLPYFAASSDNFFNYVGFD